MDLVQTPLARSDGLVIEELGEELLVYDTETDRAHSLSPEAAGVWRRCDGRTPAEGLRAQLNLDAETVARALAELEACKLLEAPPEPTLDVVHNGGTTRRDLGIKAAKIGAATAVGYSMILTAAAPAPAQAVTEAFCASLEPQGNCGVCAQAGCCCCTPGTNNPDQTQVCSATFAGCCQQIGDGNVSNCSAEQGGAGQCPPV